METFLKSRAGAVRLATLLMILCFLGVTGFLYWLSITAEPTEIVIEEPEAEMVNEVAFAAFSAGTDAFVGQEISIRAVSVTSLLEPHAFWTYLADGQTPYLLHLSEALLADSVTVSTGAAYDVTGMVTVMTVDILDAWEAAGAFPLAVNRSLAEFAENFIEVTAIAESESSEPPGPSS